MGFHSKKAKYVIKLAKDTIFKWYGHNVSLISAGISFYTIICVVPLLIFILNMANMAIGDVSIQTQLYKNIRALIGEQGAETLYNLLQNTRHLGSGIFAYATGLFGLVFGASHVFAQLNRAIDMIWKKKSGGEFRVLPMIKGRFLSFLAVIGVGFLISILLLASASAAVVTNFLKTIVPGQIYIILIEVGKFALLVALVMLLFALLYKYLPDRKVSWNDALTGGFIASFLFSIGRFIFEFFIVRSRYGSAEGIAGSVIFILIWIYFSTQTFFIGAEITRALNKNS